jgi:hypothetical protein
MSEYRESIKGGGLLRVDREEWFVEYDTSPRRVDGGPDLRYRPTLRKLRQETFAEIANHIEPNWKVATALRAEVSRERGYLTQGLPGGMNAEVSATTVTIVTRTNLRVSSQEEATAVAIGYRELIRRATERQLSMFLSDPPYIPDPAKASDALKKLHELTEKWSLQRPPARFSIYVGGPEASLAKDAFVAFFKAPPGTVEVIPRQADRRVLDLYLCAQSWNDAQRAVDLALVVWEASAPSMAIVRAYSGY